MSQQNSASSASWQKADTGFMNARACTRKLNASTDSAERRSSELKSPFVFLA